MDDSILATIKKMLGLDPSYTPFDQDVIVLINSTFMTLHQLGIGPKEGFHITDYSSKWSEFITNNVNLRGVQEYVYMKVRMVFDPPGNSFVMEALKQQCQELEWRMNVQAESVEDFHFVEKENNPHL
jgi:hypothetical protein